MKGAMQTLRCTGKTEVFKRRIRCYGVRAVHSAIFTACAALLLCTGCGDEFGILLKELPAAVHSTIQVSPSSYAFGNVRSGQSGSDVTFTLTNTGTSSVTIDSIILADTANFTLTPPAETSIASGASITFSVRFSPANTGTKTSTVTITHDATGSPSVISISGVGMPGEIYWTGTDCTINCVNRDGTGNQALLTVPGIPLDIELYIPGEQIYWTEYTGSEYQIRRADLDAGNAATFSTAGLYNSASHHGPATIAIDPANGYIYFSVYKTSALVNDIWRSALDTFSAVKWKTPNRPYTYGLCLDTIRANMYFTVNNYWDVISPAAGSGNNGDACYGNYASAGSGFSTPVSGTGSLPDSTPMRDIASDNANGRIFYVTNDASGRRIIRARYDFQEITEWIPSGSYGIQKIALDLADRKIYWTSAIDSSIYRADLDTPNSNIETFLTMDSMPTGIAIVP